MNWKEKKKLRRQWKPLPTLIKKKEPLWYREPWSSSTKQGVWIVTKIISKYSSQVGYYSFSRHHDSRSSKFYFLPSVGLWAEQVQCDHFHHARYVFFAMQDTPFFGGPLAIMSTSSEMSSYDAHMHTEKKRKDSAGSDDKASMIEGGDYLGARTLKVIRRGIHFHPCFRVVSRHSSLQFLCKSKGTVCARGGRKKIQHRHCNSLPTKIKEKEPLWYRVP